MKFARAVLVSIAALALVAPSALGKGASEATITGPGLDEPIVMAGEGFAGGEDLMQLAESAGFFPAVFAQTPDPMLETRPAGALGPAYTIAYAMPGPNNEAGHARPEALSLCDPESGVIRGAGTDVLDDGGDSRRLVCRSEPA